MCKCCSPKTAFLFRVLYASSGILIGLIVCVVFNISFDNKYAAYLGLGSALMAGICLLEFIFLYVKAEVLHTTPQVPILCVFGVIGAIGISFGLGALVTFLGLGIADTVDHKDLSLPRTYYIVAVWAFAIFKWSLTIFLYALKTFRKIFNNQFLPLLENDSLDQEEASSNTSLQS